MRKHHEYVICLHRIQINDSEVIVYGGYDYDGSNRMMNFVCVGDA